MIAPISEGTFQTLCPSMKQHRDDARKSVAGRARITTKRIAEGLVVHDHQQVDRTRRRTASPMPRFRNESFMLWICPIT